MFRALIARLDAIFALPTHTPAPRDPLDGYRDQDAIRGLPDRTTITATHRPVAVETRRAA